jgi:hypothetical protein
VVSIPLLGLPLSHTLAYILEVISAYMLLLYYSLILNSQLDLLLSFGVLLLTGSGNDKSENIKSSDTSPSIQKSGEVVDSDSTNANDPSSPLKNEDQKEGLTVVDSSVEASMVKPAELGNASAPAGENQKTPFVLPGADPEKISYNVKHFPLIIINVLGEFLVRLEMGVVLEGLSKTTRNKLAKLITSKNFVAGHLEDITPGVSPVDPKAEVDSKKSKTASTVENNPSQDIKSKYDHLLNVLGLPLDISNSRLKFSLKNNISSELKITIKKSYDSYSHKRKRNKS